MLAAHKQELTEAGIDYDQALERFAGDAEFYEEMVFKFLDDPHYGELQQALQIDDEKAAKNAAHMLKGVVGNLSFTRYFQAISALDTTLYEGSFEQASALLPAVDEAHAAVIAILHQLKA